MNLTAIQTKKTVYQLAFVALLGSYPIGASAMEAISDNSAQAVVQQQKTVTGSVTDDRGEFLPGVTIVVKEKPGSGTITDANGQFSLEVDPTHTLVFSFIGYKTLEKPAREVDGGTLILKEDALNLDEVVVTGYTSQRKADLTGSVSVVKVDQIRSSTSGSAMRAAQGKVAGMSVSANG